LFNFLDKNGESMSQNDLDNSLGKPLFAAKLGDIGQLLDRCFLPLGLQQVAGVGTRQYSGEVNGRTINITIAARTRTQYLIGSIRYRKFTGLWLDMSVSTPLMSRLMLGQPSGWGRKVTEWMQRLYGNKPVTNLASTYEQFTVFAHEPAWAERFLADTAVQTHLSTLMQNPDLPPGAAVFLSPGSWKWTTPAQPSSFTPEAVQTWLAQLTIIAKRSEQNPPGTAVQPSWLERQNATVRAFILAAAFLLGIPFLMFMCCVLPALTLILINAR
jgi:hypothetical protein